MVKPFRQALEEMVNVLSSRPEIEVFDLVFRPPASADDIATAEALVGRPLPDDLRAFYLEHDGVFLAWDLKGKMDRPPLQPFMGPDYGEPRGLINLLPITDAFTADWVDTSTINWTNRAHQVIYGVDQEEDEDDQRVHAVLVDNFSRFYHADLVFGPLDRPPWMLVADDHGAALLESNLSTFSTYLDVVLALWGTGRMAGYEIAHHAKPVEITVSKRRTTLDEVLEELRSSSD